MKTSYIAVLVAVLGLVGAVQTNAQAATPHSMVSSSAATDSLTRAQVYRQLVSAEKRGLLQQGDTVYPETAASYGPHAHVSRLSVDNSLARAERHGLLTQPGNEYPAIHTAMRKGTAWAPKILVAGESSIQHLYENP
ncbi:DUF4148 domain-containing protein [Pandoraea commovens]|uniref:DUF4148 domain-containing protein n=1 Tax=Pandoraea commovens TaxID=2508289 RepID=A0A5E4RGB7_9BURK|nr:DUF4148 domain-containing protein [Pandoraea commovens]UVA81888.1 DUF4148 domain-containing protein [Pandoraea commovens]VVD62406.1 hypothetical protein PCO31010_00175 [Pandoraea commovens]